MSLSTRGVLALLIVITMVAALIAGRRGAELLATWLMTAGFALATVWAGLGAVWTYEFGADGALSPEVYVSLVMMGAALTIYFGFRATDEAGLAGGWD